LCIIWDNFYFHFVCVGFTFFSEAVEVKVSIIILIRELNLIKDI